MTHNAISGGRNVARSINSTLLADINGNVVLKVQNLLTTGTEGDTIFFNSTGVAVNSKTVKFARIIDSDSEFTTEKTVSDSSNTIYDIRDKSVWLYNGSTWVKQSSTMYTALERGRIYSNSRTGKAYFYNSATDFRFITGTRISAAAGNRLQAVTDGLYLGTEAPPASKDQYVDSVNGLDTNDGTQAKPLKTIQEAFNRMIPGVFGYRVLLEVNGQYEISKPITMDNMGVTILSYPIPSWVSAYTTANPGYEWQAANEITRPRLFMNKANMLNTPAGYKVQAFDMKNHSYLWASGLMIDPGTLPTGKIYSNGFFGDIDQVGQVLVSHCVIKLNGVLLLTEGNASSTVFNMYRCYYQEINAKAVAVNNVKLRMSATGGAVPAGSYPEHPYFNNGDFPKLVRDSITGVNYYNNVPMNCTYPELYGGPTFP